jgi:ferrous-iron efflux pump FieF
MSAAASPDRLRQHATERLRQRATYASVGVAAVLIATKLGAYLVTESVSLLSSLVDSSADLLASLVTLVGVHHALRPPDCDHRFGHGKAEGLAALAQAAFVAGSAAFLIVEAVNRLITPIPIQESGVGIAVMLLSMGLTAALIHFQRHVVRITGSLAVGADRLHYTGDLLTNGAVIAALLLVEATGTTLADPLMALAIAAFLIRGALAIAAEALDVLMDRELPDPERAAVKAVVLGHAAARGLHDLRTRNGGTGKFIELHLELDHRLRLDRAHAITDEIEHRLRTAFPGADVLIHQEPAGLRDERLDDRIGTGESD